MLGVLRFRIVGGNVEHLSPRSQRSGRSEINSHHRPGPAGQDRLHAIRNQQSSSQKFAGNLSRMRFAKGRAQTTLPRGLEKDAN